MSAWWEVGAGCLALVLMMTQMTVPVSGQTCDTCCDALLNLTNKLAAQRHELEQMMAQYNST